MILTHRPAAGRVTEVFGPRPKPTPTSPAIHYGIDYGWGGGDAIYAAASGRVKSYGRQPGFEAYGNRLVIDHGDGYETWYCHLSGAHVGPGDFVRGGQHIAEMGATGNVTGKHLHFELRVNGRAVDPAPYQTEEDDMPEYKDWSQQSKDDLHRDFWNGVGWRLRWQNHEGIEVFPIDMLKGADGNAAQAKTSALAAADAVTPGIEGVKFDGATYEMAKRAAQRVETTQGGGPAVSVEDLADAIVRDLAPTILRGVAAAVANELAARLKE